MPACRVAGGSHGNGQIVRDGEQADFIEQPVHTPRLLHNLIQGCGRHNGGGTGKRVERVRPLLRLRGGKGAILCVRQFLAHKGLIERRAIFRGVMGVGLGDLIGFKGCRDGVEHGFFLLLRFPRCYMGLGVCGIVYDTDFINFADLGNCAGLGLFVIVRCADVKGKGHFGQIAAPDGFIYRPCLLCVRQACPHFKPLFSDGQGKGFRASRKRNAAAVMIGYQHNAVKINTPQCVRVYDLSHSADLGGRIEYYRDTL